MSITFVQHYNLTAHLLHSQCILKCAQRRIEWQIQNKKSIRNSCRRMYGDAKVGKMNSKRNICMSGICCVYTTYDVEEVNFLLCYKFYLRAVLVE